MVLPISLPLAPGVDMMRTPLQVGRGLINSNLVRFRNGLIQKLAGCRRLTSSTFAGVCRCLFGFQDLLGYHYLAIGTNQLLQIFDGNRITYVSPIGAIATVNLATGSNPLATVNGSPTVTITDTSQPPVGSWIEIVNLTYVNGILLQGPYQVVTSSGANYTINAATNANATGSGGSVLSFTPVIGHSNVIVGLGSYVFTNGQNILVAISTSVGGVAIPLQGTFTVSVSGSIYTINGTGNAVNNTQVFEDSNRIQIQFYVVLPAEGAFTGVFGAGVYGAGPFGVGGNNGANSGLMGSQPGVQFAVEWSMDRWGGNLVFCWITSTIYQWIPPAPANLPINATNVAVPVAGAPSAVVGLFVAAPQQQAMAWGIYSSVLGEQDPLLIGWCDVANLNAWTATATNQAGSFRLSSGNLIIGGTWFGATGLFWTDLDLWAMTYIGFPLVYGFNKVAPNCGLNARRAWAAIGSVVVWMSQNDFFIYQGGSVQPLPCSVRDFVFNTIDVTNLEQMHADANTYGNEITWWFPQVGSNGVCTGAVKWHAAGGEWDITQSGLSISAWTDQSVWGPPIGSFYTNLLEQFETTIDFDGQILDSYILSGFFQIAEMEEILFVERVYPDIYLPSGGSVSLTFYFSDDLAAANNPALVRTYGPYTVTSATEYLIVRGRGRVMQIRLDCNTQLNTFWRYGEPTATCSIDGRK